MVHVPVMVDEVREQLAPARGGIFVDCTIGLGGHAQALLEAGASRLIGLDRDQTALSMARERLMNYGARVELVHADFRDLGAVLDARGIGGVDGVLADLGVSSLQLDSPGRGFSFRRDEALDMRMDASSGVTAADAIAAADERTLADVIYRFGEERYARRVARAIVAARARGAIQTTGQLADIVRRAVPRRGHMRIDPATRTFQAVRIWINHELDGLDGFLARTVERLNVAGRLAVMTFHSLEDRIVKHTLRSLQAAGGLTVLTKRPVVPSAAEIERNPRARSAKLRAAERVQ
ncbi:MAG TPA: 16S rRNA (cytosine(1402)-N(4))-methyltransferase RsmH [Vicinamibacterales bacterium]|nr:16S rRNA (cytosine(1402)-N(4))-methyltransferase RsmH [Vicinamibacterales bacterium]